MSILALSSILWIAMDKEQNRQNWMQWWYILYNGSHISAQKRQIASLPSPFQFASCKFLTHIHYACLSYILELFPILHFHFPHSIF